MLTWACFSFDLTIKKKIPVAENKSIVKSDQCLQLFSSWRQPPLLALIVYAISSVASCYIYIKVFFYWYALKHYRCLYIYRQKQGRIHGNPVADGWAGAVMRKPLGIQKYDGPTDRPTYQPTYRPTGQGVESCVRD